MPKLDLDMFDSPPKVGDSIRVTGKVKDINQDTGEVEVSYDDVSIVNKDKSRKDDDDSDNKDMENLPEEVIPESQSLDDALARAFPNTQ